MRRLATVLVILGLGQSLLPCLFRIGSSTLTISHRQSSPASDEARGDFLISQMTQVESRQEDEPDGESSDSGEILENLSYLEGISESRPAPIPLDSSCFERLSLEQGQTVASQRRSWSIRVHATFPPSMTVTFCRFLC